HTLRGSFQRNDGTQDALGVGGYDLADRAYSRTASESIVRVSERGPLARYWFAESRGQMRRVEADFSSNVQSSTVRVLDAFTSGGAQQAGGRQSTEFELATDIDYARKGHAVRVGAL